MLSVIACPRCLKKWGVIPSFCFPTIISLTLNYEAGHIAVFPVIDNTSRISEIERIVIENIDLGKVDWDSSETSWNFEIHPIVKKLLAVFIGETMVQLPLKIFMSMWN